MGLCDDERNTGIYWSLYRITKLIRDWKERKEKYPPYGTEQILALVDKLWPAFLCDQKNGLHWVMGSSSSNTITCENEHGGKTPWQVAMIYHCEKAYKVKEKDEDDPFKPRDSVFDATKMVSIPYLLQQNGEWAKGYIFEIYQEMEQMIYYLRRYNDEFQKGYPELNDLISKIQGACFEIFANEDDYAKAYIIHEMLEKMYGPRYPYDEENWDVVTKIMVQHCIHHDFTRLMKKDLKDLAVFHVELVKAYVAARTRHEHNWIQDEELLQLRMTLICEFSHSIHEYEHIRKDVLKQLAGSALDEAVPVMALLMTKKAIEFKKLKKEKETWEVNDWRLNELNVYGYGGSHDMYDFVKGLKDQIPIPDPVPEKPKKKKKSKAKKR